MSKQNKQVQEENKNEVRAYKNALVEGLPPINLGALFMPPIWGPAHGIWVTILFYPIWLFADNLLYAAYSNPEPLSITLAVLMVVIVSAVTIIFARASQGYACQRALKRGKTKETYLKEQRTRGRLFLLLLLLCFLRLQRITTCFFVPWSVHK